MTRAKLGVTVDPSYNASDSDSQFIAWGQLTDPHDVHRRTLKQSMFMRALGTRYLIDNVEVEEWLTLAPGKYDGVIIMGANGKSPQVKPLLGDMVGTVPGADFGETPDEHFYSFLGVGSSLRLPSTWIRVFGLRCRNSTIVFHEDGVVLRGVEVEN